MKHTDKKNLTQIVSTQHYTCTPDIFLQRGKRRSLLDNQQYIQHPTYIYEIQQGFHTNSFIAVVYARYFLLTRRIKDLYNNLLFSVHKLFLGITMFLLFVSPNTRPPQKTFVAYVTFIRQFILMTFHMFFHVFQ